MRNRKIKQRTSRDPDEGLELSEEVKELLRRSLEDTKRGKKGKPMEQVFKELGLTEEKDAAG